jgi:hypothetical protein
MSSIAEIKRLLRSLADTKNETGVVLICEVREVYDYSCDVIDILSGDEIKGVRLQAGTDAGTGLTIKPLKNSVVVVSAISVVDRYVSMYSEIDSIILFVGDSKVEVTSSNITFNDNQANSYLTDINKLVSEFNEIRLDINNLKQLLTTWVPVIQDGGASLKAASANWAAQLMQPVVTVNDLKDEKIKH